jgi:hypothetical protein
MKIYALLFLAIIPFISLGQTYSSKVSDSTILAFMKWEIQNGEKYAEANKFRMNRKTSDKILKFDTLNFYYPDSLHQYDWQYRAFLFNRHNKIDTLFSNADIESLFIQFTALKDTVWSHKISGAKIKNWNFPKNQYTYSIPIFSYNNKYVLIKKSFFCGNVCAYGGIYLYEKIDDNNWKLLKILHGWMS